MEKIKIAEIKSDLLDVVKELLVTSKLPVEDIKNGKIYFLGAFDDNNTLVGTAGLEIYGTNGLFRSLAVSDSSRSNGIGKKLHDEIVIYALINGLKDLYLLTTTATKYFEKAGWVLMNRDEVPEDVKRTNEFSSICPSTAQCMHYSLPSDKELVAVKIFKSGLNCAQSVFLPFAMEYDLNAYKALKLSTGFGAGMVYRGETCGAVTGAMMAIGLKYGRKSPHDTDARDTTYSFINKFYDEFKKLNGSIICKELLKNDISTEEGKIKAHKEGMFENICPKLVKDAASLTDKLLNS